MRSFSSLLDVPFSDSSNKQYLSSSCESWSTSFLHFFRWKISLLTSKSHRKHERIYWSKKITTKIMIDTFNSLSWQLRDLNIWKKKYFMLQFPPTSQKKNLETCHICLNIIFMLLQVKYKKIKLNDVFFLKKKVKNVCQESTRKLSQIPFCDPWWSFSPLFETFWLYFCLINIQTLSPLVNKKITSHQHNCNFFSRDSTEFLIRLVQIDDDNKLPSCARLEFIGISTQFLCLLKMHRQKSAIEVQTFAALKF